MVGVALAATAVFAVIGFVALNRIGDLSTDADTLGEELVPVRDRLVRVERALRSSQYAFTAMLSEPDPVQRVLAVEEVRQTLSEGERAWADYRERALDLDCGGGVAEADLQADFDAAKAELDELVGPVGLTLVSPDQYSVEEILAAEAFRRLVEVQEIQRAVATQIIDDCYAPLIDARLAEGAGGLERARREVLVLLAAAFVVGGMLFAVSYRTAAEHERQQAVVSAERARQARRNELEARLQRALGMAQEEPEAHRIVVGALEMSVPRPTAQLLLADSLDDGFIEVFDVPGATDAPRCPVTGPAGCPSAQGSETKVFPSGDALDTCPHLRSRGGGCAAVCVPVAIAGKAVGVLHAVVGSDASIGRRQPSEGGQALVSPRPLDEEERAYLELIADRLGNRLSLIRAMHEREAQARSDPLTGLLNRRSLDVASRALVERGTPYVVAFGDLDRFKALNDTHGHETGDRALRLFARVLRDTVRPNDVVCRYGGEEFVVVIPDVDLAEAADVVERVRQRLAQALEPGMVPWFTVSFGLAESHQAEDFDGVVAMADRALLEAKAAGRDRVVLAR